MAQAQMETDAVGAVHHQIGNGLQSGARCRRPGSRGASPEAAGRGDNAPERGLVRDLGVVRAPILPTDDGAPLVVADDRVASAVGDGISGLRPPLVSCLARPLGGRIGRSTINRRFRFEPVCRGIRSQPS